MNDTVGIDRTVLNLQDGFWNEYDGLEYKWLGMAQEGLEWTGRFRH